jgi:mRNA interferase MazF
MVISPDEINRHLRTVIVAPMTTAIRTYPTRVNIFFRGKEGQVALDQLRSVDKLRLVKKLGNADLKTCTEVRSVLMEMVQ